MYEQEANIKKTKVQAARVNSSKEEKEKLLPSGINDRRIESNDNRAIQAKITRNSEAKKIERPSKNNQDVVQLIATGGIVDVPTLIAAVRADAKIQRYEGNPNESCEEAANYLGLNIGGFNKQFLGIGIWPDTASAVSGDHLLTIVTINGQQVALDVTAGQFGGGPIYDTLGNWEADFLAKAGIADKGVKYKVFGNAKSAATETEGLFFGGRYFGDYDGTVMQNPPAVQAHNAGNVMGAPAGGGGRRHRCFITTACVQYHGLDDNSMELETLRDFRDNYILYRPNGKELVSIYYDYAPDIVAAIDTETNAAKTYHELFQIISKCVQLIQVERSEEAYQIYINMVLKLSKQYVPNFIAPKFLDASYS